MEGDMQRRLDRCPVEWDAGVLWHIVCGFLYCIAAVSFLVPQQCSFSISTAIHTCCLLLRAPRDHLEDHFAPAIRRSARFDWLGVRLLSRTCDDRHLS